MDEDERNFSVGKLTHKFLNRLLQNYVNTFNYDDSRVIMGSKLGEDAAVIDMGDKYLVAKTDPITFTTNKIGYYVVNVNVNDIVCTGALPKWFQSTVLLPEGSNEELITSIFKSIHDTCKSFNISVVGGHTEITSGLKRPIVIGSLLGEVDKDNLILTSNAKVGDDLILTKGVFIEGTSIIGYEKEKFLLDCNFDLEFVRRCQNYLFNPGISVYKEATLISSNFNVNAMHDPTEGGLLMGIAEMALSSKTGIEIYESKITVLPEPSKLSEIFGLNPLNTISSGSLLIAAKKNNTPKIIELLKKNDIRAEKIGKFIPKERGLNIETIDGQIQKLVYSEKDQIVKIFNV